jgi:hypothetical protein
VTGNSCFIGSNAGAWYIKGFKLTTTTSGTLVQVNNYTFVDLANMEFGSCPSIHIYCLAFSTIFISTAYKLTGGGTYHMATNGGNITQTSGVTNTASGTFAFSSAFAYVSRMGRIYNAANTWSGGTITGKRYIGSALSLIQTDSGSATYFPGDVAGTVSTGAVYT